jgi:hypothetical protein
MSKFEMYVESLVAQFHITIDGIAVKRFSVDDSTRSIFFTRTDDEIVQVHREAFSDAIREDGETWGDGRYCVKDATNEQHDFKFYKNVSDDAVRQLQHEMWEWD